VKQRKYGGNFWSMTRKRSSEILADESQQKFWEKVKSDKFSAESEFF